MTSPDLTRSSPEWRTQRDHYEINEHNPSLLFQEDPLMIRMRGTTFTHFLSLEQDSENTRVDADLSGYGNTQKRARSVFGRRLHKTHQPTRWK
jgi:hypothetical protein